MTVSPESGRECSTVDSWAICRGEVDKAHRERLAPASRGVGCPPNTSVSLMAPSGREGN